VPQGRVGVAIRGGKKVVCNDIENDPIMELERRGTKPGIPIFNSTIKKNQVK
jgi:hypothetical protein